MPRDPRYDEPFHWWGPGWEYPAPRDLGDLLRDGTLHPETAAVLWAALARRRSLVVVAGPSGTGKSTLLHALLPLLPAGTRRIYLRGCFETFAFLTNPAVEPRRTALMANEISPHLPVYLWGPGVARVLAATDQGFALLATAHAATIGEFVASLVGSPLRLPASRLAAFEFVAIMERTDVVASGRRVCEVWRLHGEREGVVAEPVMTASLHDISQKAHPHSTSDHPPIAPPIELSRRVAALTQLRDREISRLPEDSEGSLVRGDVP